MSMILCEGCSGLIDSDDDPLCFVEVGNMRAQTKDIVWCETCRDRHEAEDEDDGTSGLVDDESISQPGAIK